MLYLKWIYGNIQVVQITLLALIAGLTIFYYKLRKE